MATRVTEPREAANIFGIIREKNVTFCIDTSGSMYKGLQMVKEHIAETLEKMGNSGKPYTFNIIDFNSEVKRWSDKLVTCTPQTVAVAKEWITNLSAKTGTNTGEALLTALSDPLCDAIYLVTDGLPDQNPLDILERVASIGGLRPIHCIYLSTEETTDSAAIEFLEDLAIDSYGSFHIVSLTLHGCVERITPIYHAEHAQEHIIRTLNGTVHSNEARCSVATTLQVDPEQSINLAPRTVLGIPPPWSYPPSWGPYWYDWLGLPFRYNYYPYAWSRYRPAKGWLKSQEQMLEHLATSGLSPAAGSLLINKRVLARRTDDGYFYQATVKSQISSEKFLLGFGPCKHGKFTDVTYQDTHVYDIIDYEDAKRHTILTGDKVLAPWKPDSERFGPGTVIEGHEKRQAEGPMDRQITVSFTNGKVENVAADVAVWIPKEVYERITLELKMPQEARLALTTEERYPMQSFEGYPTSGLHASPAEYKLADPLYLDYDPMIIERRPWRYPFCPPYPLILKTTGSEHALKHSVDEKKVDENSQVPGTNLTQKELDKRIALQLREHKWLLDEKETEKGTQKAKESEKLGDSVEVVKPPSPQEVKLDDMELQQRLEARRKQWEKNWHYEQESLKQEIEQERLLKKREKREHNMLQKHVHFKDAHTPSGAKGYNESESDAEETDKEPYFSDPEDGGVLHDCGVNTDSSLLYRPVSKLVSRRPPWKSYWRADPSMPITNSSHGPFRETALQAPLEARNLRQSPYITEWSSPVYQYVDPQAKYNHTDSVEKVLRPQSVPQIRHERAIPRPPHSRPLSADTKEHMRKEFKRRQEELRQTAWNMRMKHNDQVCEVKQDQHKEHIQAQIQREKDRQVMEQRQIEQSREQKKNLSKEIREKIESSQKRELGSEDLRLKAMQHRREQREQVQQMRDRYVEETMQHRAEIKAQRSQKRWDQVQHKLDMEEAETARRNQQHQNAKLNRLHHFENLEERGQRRLNIGAVITDRNQSIFQSVPMC